MTDEVDITEPIRGTSQLANLVEHVLATDPENETDWLEWKVGLDLSSWQGQFAIAKQILGFGNRHPDDASQNCGGCSYLVLGAEPNNLVGQASIDPADLDAVLGRYVDHGSPSWSPIWVSVEGQRCLIITVEPPEWGDPIHTLQKEADKFKAGQIFVRRAGSTHTASPAQIRMLTARASKRSMDPPQVELRNLTGKVTPVGHSSGQVDQWIEREREWFMQPIAPPDESTATVSLSDLEAQRLSPGFDLKALRDAVNTASKVAREYEKIAGLVTSNIPENRTEEAYTAEVESYLEAARTALPGASLAALLDGEHSQLQLEISNPSVRNLVSLQIIVDIEGPVSSYYEIPTSDSMPDLPRRWGPRSSHMLSVAPLPLGFDLAHLSDHSPYPDPGYETENRGGFTRITFDPIDLRPKATIRLPLVDTVVGIGAAGQELTCRWSATSTSIDGICEGEFVLEVAQQVIDTTESVRNASEADQV